MSPRFRPDLSKILQTEDDGPQEPYLKRSTSLILEVSQDEDVFLDCSNIPLPKKHEVKFIKIDEEVSLISVLKENRVLGC